MTFTERGHCGTWRGIVDDIAIVSVMQSGYGHAALLIILAAALAYAPTSGTIGQIGSANVAARRLPNT
jgi:hypothetical protein